MRDLFEISMFWIKRCGGTRGRGGKIQCFQTYRDCRSLCGLPELITEKTAYLIGISFDFIRLFHKRVTGTSFRCLSFVAQSDFEEIRKPGTNIAQTSIDYDVSI